ncbi:MAG: aminopeptidase [Eubacteriales bacterium]|nr:aminopeptidase [Eubacteriales bacterium]
MKDPRIDKLTDVLVNHSCRVKPGDNVLIEVTGHHMEFAVSCIAAVYAAGGNPHIKLHEPEVNRALLMHANEAALKVRAANDKALMEQMQCYIGMRGGDNTYEMADVPAENTELYASLYGKPVHMQTRLPKTRWVVLRYPSPSMAQAAGMSTEAFEEFYFNVCCLDYDRMGRAMQALMELMDKTDKVQIVGPGTDLTFSIAGIPTCPCAGECNIPDGEVYTAPVKDSVNGVLTYNTPTLYQGKKFENVHLEFKNGRIVKATANMTDELNKILDTDEGARSIGEFAIGVNPYINNAMLDTLFDEKIAGSIHITPGNAYDTAFNGNRSAIHWDMVLIQTPEYGGGEIRFDDVTVRRDGRFVLPQLEGLNPENLV